MVLKDKVPTHKSFQKIGHTQNYDVLSTYSPAFLLKYYRIFNDVLELSSILDSNSNKDILELGCASGEISRYLKLVYPAATYRGLDISEESIKRAKIKYPNTDFSIVTSDVTELNNITQRPSILFAKDVVVHQPKALAWLEQALLVPTEYAILRMRVRKSGKTELDPKKSYQEYQGELAPWILISVDDIKKTILKIPNAEDAQLIFSQPTQVIGNSTLHLPPDIMDGSTEICSAVLVVKKSNNPNTTVNFESFERKELPWKITILDRIKQKWFRLLQKLS